MSVSGTGTPICGTCGRESYNSECEVCRLRRDANAHLERAWKAEARVKDFKQALKDTERREILQGQRANDAEARCERMRQDFDIKLGLAEGEAMLWNRRYNELAVAHGQPPIPMSRLDTDTTAGEQG